MNLEITDNRGDKQLTPAGTIPIGQMFTGRIGGYPDRLFVVAYNGAIISLSDPAKGYWSSRVFDVADYRPVKRVQITLKSDDDE